MEEIVKKISELERPFWETGDFWIFFVIGIASLIASIKAFIEAKEARKAANDAGQVVKIQTITIELSEIIQKLDKLEMTIQFSQARDFYSEINRRIKRLTAPFKDAEDYKEVILTIFETLDELKESLAKVRPIDREEEENPVENSVYFAVEKHFSDLGGHLAELMGYFEKRTIKIN
jgi:hypothetical protein